ncbi:MULTISPECIES: FdhF/YdeP family oxidoreductase [unclassified Chelatococcus]|uniref:FdhF/YdeP family oxidoreductase n=1 Tax=unclassified Chelatococcus TaxID=2638111 RepID=UPI001BCFCBA5|nr:MULTISPECIES: FdhF/YdeP family oxidoreductase [unclassified Chelatococcus]CAH1655417.1 Protein YdeP [Hyphomicrobiales bacterium]MBS7742613.1 FdhF/YdeP family oxidoreductase [Chelatococcus sp. HY11]MBX3542269.1 FdhF/YdeP family oxidoreductase [Chelatococcus sp.]MCO5075513.1 FdhF/YdeP family oxidoreductase [Chelatococcus sp.]CAH1695472.1 Protein YdeP [Hyphomicrobiales bacterium]
MPDRATYKPYKQPTGGWGSVRSLVKHSTRQGAVSSAVGLLRDHNKTGGYMCTSCAWAKPAEPHIAEFCENGAKATFWDLTSKRTTPTFFSTHTVSQLLDWTDHDLENQGRLTHPMRYDHASDKYVEVPWQDAFSDIGARLRVYEPRNVIFYASGRASLETSFMYQLLARLYGNNNLPDSSNMCHETTSVALPQSIGTPVGTVLLEDFAQTDCILSFGQNVGTNSPRLLHTLQEVRERQVPIVVFNPLRERGWETFVNPQRPGQMVANKPTLIATQYYQPRAGSDIAVMMGMAKFLFAWDDEAQTSGMARILDSEFIAAHTHGFAAFEAAVRALSWDEIIEASGLTRDALREAAETYAKAQSVIAIYGMGLTQHKLGIDSVQMLINLLLMRGNIGRAGAGICPVRGHSNVQGQRTVGIAEKVELVPLDIMAERYGFEPPREDGMNTVEACEAIVAGTVRAFIGLGGNFVRAIPERALMEEKWRGLDLSVQVATKLNRTHLITARTSYIFPTLVRSEIDEQATGPQIVTMEDSTTCIHASRGIHRPASENLLSEPRIVAEIAKAALPPTPQVPWDEWVGNYALVRDEIAAVFPDDFHDFNQRLDLPGGFPRPIGARDRRWDTNTGKANFKLPRALHASFDTGDDPSVMRLITLRSNDQFNTTIYGHTDRLRGIYHSRMIVMMNAKDRERFGIAKDGTARLMTAADDGIERSVGGLQVIDYDIPEGTIAAYYPECNPLIPLWQFAEESKTPAAKSVPVRVTPE